MISAVDDSENVYVIYFNAKSGTSKVRSVNIKRVKQAEESAQAMTLRNKHFFGMGYPYFITGYADQVAVTTDYGILLFQVRQQIQQQ
mmetsp:Transcript_11673/g.15841  ORF Transcript_11673/g.15841 Transcript_11673/m.15841 type:complete len:87 (+) Transcript_11673:876-1136(+)